jgi:hypothetical protein
VLSAESSAVERLYYEVLQLLHRIDERVLAGGSSIASTERTPVDVAVDIELLSPLSQATRLVLAGHSPRYYRNRKPGQVERDKFEQAHGNTTA